MSPPFPTPAQRPSTAMATFDSSCDYCGEWDACSWVFDRAANEDRVACVGCVDERQLIRTPDRRLAT